ncbi:hypothetical protein Tco_1275810, partial [Tanacetum coccineum]
MLTKFDMESVRTATTPYEAAKTKLKDETNPPVNVHLYRSMIGSLMYLTASRPDIMFAVSACSRHQVTPLTSHLNAVKKIFKYLKGQPKLGLWYPKDSPLSVGRLRECKKQTIVATSSTEAEYVAAASCCGQTTRALRHCEVPEYFISGLMHIEIRHHFIRDANEKNLIQVLKIHTDDNVADLLTKAFDGDQGFEYRWSILGWWIWLVAAGIVYAVNTSIYAAELVCAGSIMFLLADLFLLVVTCFCCAQFDIAGWLVSATSHLVSAGSLQSCWYNNLSFLLDALLLLVAMDYADGSVFMLYKDDHNKIAYLGRERGCEDFTDILSYLDHSPLRYALTHAPPVVFDSLVKQFWATAVVRPNAAGSHDLVATIDGREVVVTESLIRTQLQFDDANGIFDMPINDILEGMRVIGYPTDGTVTFLKNHLSPQWRFLVHTLMHCLSPKSGSWNQFPSSIATALICLSTGRVYNFSRFILEGMIGNLKAKQHKFLMYPRFLQMIVALETADRTPRPTFDFTRKMFANMKFKWEGQPIPLTPPMLAIAAAGDDAAAEAHLVPHSPPVSPVREPTPERQPVSERPPSPSPTIPETEWVVPNPVSPVTDWRPWPYVPVHSPIRDPTPEPESPPTPPAQTFIFEEPLPRPHGYVNPDCVEPIIFGPQPRPDNYLVPEDLDNIISMEDGHLSWWISIVVAPVRPDVLLHQTADAAAEGDMDIQAVPEPAGPSVAVIRKVPMLIWKFPEDLPNVSEERAKELDDLMMRMTETDWLNLMMQEKKKQALADLRYRALKGQPMKKFEVTQMMLVMDRLLSAQYNLFRPKPAIPEPPSKRQRVERVSSQLAIVPAATTLHADDSDSPGGGSSNPAAAMDSAGSRRKIRVSPFADSAAGVATDPDSDDEVLAEIIFRGRSISGHGVVVVDKQPDNEIVDPRVKVETVSASASSPPRFRHKHLGVRSDDFLWDKPVEDFFSSESESDDDMENYIPPLPYSEFKDWEIVSCPP